jgi:protein Mpv17
MAKAWFLSGLKAKATRRFLGDSLCKRLLHSVGQRRAHALTLEQQPRIWMLLGMRALPKVQVLQRPLPFLLRHKEMFSNGAKACSLGASADFLVQYMTSPSYTDLDFRKTLSFAAFGFCYGGVFLTQVYRRYEVWFGVGQSLRVVLTKLAFDFFIHAPVIYVPTFYMTTGLVQGLGLSGSVAKLKDKYYETLRVYFLIWPVPMTMCFFMPPNVRVLFIASFAFFEKCIYSFINLVPKIPITRETTLAVSLPSAVPSLAPLALPTDAVIADLSSLAGPAGLSE